ncbi:hypothetical protein [Maribacter sp. Asnod1-A12]|uniref:hypothetical protein n=1 Tax=Maribacter sp. Asnod1-A12 TaxID=3160576 RepID=UPI00386B2E62
MSKIKYICYTMGFPPIIKKFLAIALIFMSIGFVARLVLFVPILVTELSNAIKENVGYYWGSFTFYLLLYILFWIVTYYMFSYGRKLYRNEF